MGVLGGLKRRLSRAGSTLVMRTKGLQRLMEAQTSELAFDTGSYEGEVRNGRMHGFGEYRFNTGDVYRGEWRHGRMHGHGVYHWPSGASYEGQWRGDRPHGRGTMYSAEGWARSGAWEHGCMLGEDDSGDPNPAEQDLAPEEPVEAMELGSKRWF